MLESFIRKYNKHVFLISSIYAHLWEIMIGSLILFACVNGMKNQVWLFRKQLIMKAWVFYPWKGHKTQHNYAMWENIVALTSMIGN